MSEPKRKYDATVARIAGKLLSAQADLFHNGRLIDNKELAREAVALARAIVAETLRTESERP